MSKSSLHIIFVTLADLPNGLGTTLRLARMTDALARLGHRVRIWNEHSLNVAPASGTSPEGNLGSVPFEYVLGTTTRGRKLGIATTKWRALQAIKSKLRKLHRTDPVDILWFNQLSFYDQFPLTRLARSLAIRTIQSYDDERHEVVGNAPTPLERVFSLNSQLSDRYCPPMADAIVVISNYLKEKYTRLADITPVYVIPTIIDCATWKCGPEAETETPVFLYAGAFNEQDEIPNLIGAFLRLKQENIPFRAVMLGGNVRVPRQVEAAKSHVHKAGMGDIVSFPGFVPEDEVRQAVCNANVLLCIRRESVWSASGLSTKLSEFLASGRAVISSEVGDVPQYLRDGDSAYLVPGTATVNQIFSKLKESLQSAERRRAIGERGRSLALQEFDTSVNMQRLDELLSAVAPASK